MATDAREVLLFRIALGYVEQGLKRGEIARRLGVSPMTVTRLLPQALATVRFQADVPRDVELAGRLAEAARLREVVIVPSVEDPWARALTFGAALGKLLDNLLLSATQAPLRVAIGGAQEMQVAVERLTRGSKLPVEVGPTALTPTEGRCARLTAPLVAAQMAFRLGSVATEYSRYGEGGGALYFAAPSTAENAVASRDELEARPQIRQIREFWSKLDVAVLGCAPMNELYPQTRERLAALGSLERVQQEALAVVANTFLDGDGNLVPPVEGVAALDVAARIEDYQACVQRGGTVVLTTATADPVSVSAVLNSRTVSHLVVDAELAAELLGT